MEAKFKIDDVLKYISKNIVCGIYKITSLTGCIYIGQGINLKSRLSHYKRLDCKAQRKLYSSFKKYGIENHIFEIVHVLEINNLSKSEIISELNKLEINYIKLYDCFNTKYGLNLTSGGDNKSLSDETKNKIGDSNRGKKRSCEFIRNMSVSRIGKPSWNKGLNMSLEARKNMSISHIGKTQSEESNKKNSESHKGNKNHFFNKNHKPESIKKQREANSKIIIQYSIYGEFIKEHTSITQASIDTNVPRSSIGSCVRLETKKAGGFVWKLKNKLKH